MLHLCNVLNVFDLGSTNVEKRYTLEQDKTQMKNVRIIQRSLVCNDAQQQRNHYKDSCQVTVGGIVTGVDVSITSSRYPFTFLLFLTSDWHDLKSLNQYRQCLATYRSSQVTINVKFVHVESATCAVPSTQRRNIRGRCKSSLIMAKSKALLISSLGPIVSVCKCS